ncbi:hypothetical protein BaRGS_00009937 [Batillaria attramentaria]|uniref:GST C-terminal domain-containing protein n=1 Tax=Batillaria attramentaria TaxID=370345 RepID=A0ABD0LHB6_9CAEN
MECNYLDCVFPDKPGDTWLFGPTFTAADITFSVLLHRLTLLGMDSRFFPAATCPHTHRYRQQLLRQPAFIRIQKEVSGLRFTLIWEDFKAISPYMAAFAGVGVTAGLAYLFLRRLR